MHTPLPQVVCRHTFFLEIPLLPLRGADGFPEKKNSLNSECGVTQVWGQWFGVAQFWGQWFGVHTPLPQSCVHTPLPQSCVHTPFPHNVCTHDSPKTVCTHHSPKVASLCAHTTTPKLCTNTIFFLDCFCSCKGWTERSPDKKTRH